MPSHLDVHVGDTLHAIKARVLDAWHRAERGEEFCERHLSFESYTGFLRTFGGRRLELLKHLRRNPAASIAALARALGRDYKRVHEDVDILVRAGLVDRDGRGLRTDYDEIRTTIAL